MRKLFFISFLILVIGLTALGYIYLRNSKKPTLSALDVIPEDVEIVVVSTHLNQLNKKLNSLSLLWTELKKDTAIFNFSEDLKYIDSLSCTEECSDLLEDSKSFFSYDIRNDQKHLLYGINLKSSRYSEGINKFLQKICTSFNPIKNSQGKEGYFSVRFKNRSSNAYLYNKNGLLLITNSQNYLSSLLAQRGRNNLNKHRLFSDLSENDNDQSDAHVFIKNDFYAQIFSAEPIKNNFDKDNKNWSSLDLTIQSNEISINGFVEHNNNNLLNAFATQEPIEPSFVNYCPANATDFCFFGTSNYLKFTDTYLKANNQNEIKTYLTQLSKFTDSDLFREWSEVTNGELSSIGFKKEEKNQKIALARIENKNNAYKFLKQLSTKSTSLDEVHSDSVYQLVNPALVNILSTGLFELKVNYAYVYQNCILFADSASTITHYLNLLNNKGSLKNNAAFVAMTKTNLSPATNLFCYQNFSEDNAAFISSLNPIFSEALSQFKRNSKRFTNMGFQVSKYKEKLYVQGYLSGNSIPSPATTQVLPSVIWEFNLDTLSTVSPQTVINHKTKETEFITSDEKGNLYLFNSKGELIWKKNVNEKIISKIHQVDFHKNDKLQYLFNTKNAIHLIDRNGDYVQGYPISLDAPATNPIAVFDYENNKTYRILVACSDNKIYNYSIEGKKTEGFEPIATTSPVSKPVEFRRINDKDFLISIDNSGRLYLNDRKGKVRIELKNGNIGTTNYSIQEENTIEKTCFVYFDAKTKSIKQLYWNDQLITKSLNPGTEVKQVEFALVNDDLRKDIILINSKGFMVYDDNGALISSFDYKDKGNYTLNTFFYKNELYFLLRNSSNQLKILNAKMQEVISEPLLFSTNPLVCELNEVEKNYIIGVIHGKMSCSLLNLN